MVLAVYEATATDDAGNVLTDAQIEVRLEVAGLPLAQIWSDRNGTVNPGNPFVTADGHVRFYAEGAAYRIVATKGAFTRELQHAAIGTAAEHDASDLLFAYVVSTAVIGIPQNGEVLPAHTFPLSARSPVNFEGSQAKADLPATAETIATIYHDAGGGAVAIGTITFAAAATVGTFIAAAAVTINAGDRIWIEFPDPRDVTLSNPSISLLLTRE